MLSVTRSRDVLIIESPRRAAARRRLAESCGSTLPLAVSVVRRAARSRPKSLPRGRDVRVVVDTDVLVSGLISSNGAPARVPVLSPSAFVQTGLAENK